MRRIAILGGICALSTLGLASNAPALGRSDLAVTAAPLNLQRMAAPPAVCPGTDDPDASAAAQEAAMECMINYARHQAGLGKLHDMGKLDGSSTNKAGDILRCNQFSHEACGRGFLFWFRRSGYIPSHCWWAGENLAWGTGGLGSVRSVMRAWMHSPPHRANILSPEYDQFGVSLRVGGLSGATAAHLWVNHFGAHC
jgi:uncharacterized protein YkwD